MELRIKHKADEISQTKTDIKEKTHSLELFTTKLSQLEQSQETSERYKDISNRFKTKQEKATRLRAQIGMVTITIVCLINYGFWVHFLQSSKSFNKNVLL